jgi:hypothetical protein
MRKLLLGAATALTFLVPGVASAADGHLDLSYSDADQGSGVNTINFGGAVNFDMTSSLEAQVDARFSRVDTSSGFNHTYSVANLHVFNRNDNFLVGGFVGVEEASFNIDAYHFGAEGQLYLSRLTLDGAIAFTSAEGGTFDENGSTSRVGATWFVTDTFSVGAGYRDLDVDGLGINSTSLNLEWQPGGGPFSFTGGYRTSEFDAAVADVDTWEVGLRWSFGTGSLFERNRSGASLSGVGTVSGGVY